MQRIAACFVATTAILHSAQWFEEMEIGPAWSSTFEDTFQGSSRVAAIKGLLIDLGEGHKALFDTETLRLVTSYAGELDWGGTPWTGAHGKLVGLKNGDHLFNTAADPGWADAAGSFEDKREIPGFGNLRHGSFNGYYRHGNKVVLDYTVHGTRILETLSREGDTLTRSLQISGKRGDDLVLRIADEAGVFTVGGNRASAKSEDGLGVVGTSGLQLAADPKNPGRLLAKIPKGDDELVVQIALARGSEPKVAAAPDFKELTAGGPGLYQEILETQGDVSTDPDSAYVTDIVTLPAENPWKSNLRFGGFDFIDEDSAALSSWNGDVWIVRGLKGDWSKLTWQRIASGLFEPLGLRVVNGVIHVNGRDQITQLIDLNGDGETDHFKVFNRDVLISPNFHEFSFDLQTDSDGNFYFTKASPVRGGGRGFDRILPHHGIVAKIPADGKGFEVLATGLRAPGGLGVGPNGEITTGENEGTWQPRCKINFFKQGGEPVFLGTEDSRHGLTKAPYTQPLAYLPMEVDNSGGSQVWVPEGGALGLNGGELLHLSYGQSGVYRVLPVPRGDTLQGGVTRLPIRLQSSAMRARFHDDKSMYVLGFRGWQTNAASECAFQRIRHNEDKVVPVPEKLEYTSTGVKLSFPVALDAELAADPSSYSAQRWDYVRGPQYGSGEFSVDNPDEAARKAALEKESQDHRNRDNVTIESVTVSDDKKTVELVLAGMKPSMQLKVAYDLEDQEGTVLQGDVHATVYPD